MKTKTNSFIIILLLLSSLSFAQWAQIGYMVVNSTDTATSGSIIRGFGTDVYFGTNKGLFRSSDNGNTWTGITYNATATLNLPMQSVLVASTGDLFAGSNNRLYKSTDNGATWTWLSAITDSLAFNEIIEINGNVVVSYNKNFSAGGVYYSSNYGTSWTLATGLPNGPMRHILKDVNTLYLAGKDGVYKSIDNGQSWILSGTGFPAPGSCAFFDVVKSGTKLFAGDVTGNGLFESADAGATWTATVPSVFTTFCQVFSLAEANNKVIASMDGVCNVGGASPVKISADTGSTWSTYTSGLPLTYYPVLGRNASGTSFFTKNGSGKQVYRTDLGTGISTLDPKSKIEIYPNPSHTTIRLNNDVAMEISIFDFTGKEIVSKKLLAPYEDITISSLSNGIYFVKAVDASGNMLTKKFVKN